MVYEELKALTAGAGEYAKDTGRSSLSVAQISVMGAISKLSASVVTYPSQVRASCLLFTPLVSLQIADSPLHATQSDRSALEYAHV